MTSEPTSGINVLVLADPGLPSRRVSSIRDHLESMLQETFSPPVALHTRTEVTRIRPDNTIDFDVARQVAREYDRVDVILVLTEIPRHTQGQPLVAEIVQEENLAVISCPTLGAWATKRRLVKLFMGCTIRLAPIEEHRDPSPYEIRWTRWGSNGRTGHHTLHADTFTGGPRTVLGMTIANDPWRTAPRLSGALATATAAGAFGIFFNSIWQMANHLSATRLLLVGLLAIVSMVAWLILSNQLWDRPAQERLGAVVMLYNLSTALTLFLCVLALYLALVVLILIGGVVVIDPGFMTSVLQEQASFSDYLHIAWLSAAMGVVAGSLGSSFDSETDLRQLTHGQRERQRQYTENEDEESNQQDTLSPT